jgi:hypothetical protein
MARIARTFAVMACAVSIGAGAISGAYANDARAVLASASVAAVSRTAAENESAAQSDAGSLLSELPLPSGATQSAIEPAEDDSLLAHPGVGPPATPNVVDDHAWWLVPGAPAEVLAYIREHLPAGATRALTSGGLKGPNVPDNEAEVFAWPPIADVLGIRWLVVHVVQLPDGSTGLRADAQVVWLTPRPVSETIPRGARVLRISVHSSIAANLPRQRPLRFTAIGKIEKVVALLNALPVVQPGLRSCPADFGVRVGLAFYTSHVKTPLAVAEVDPQGCGGVQLTIGATQQPALEGGSELIEKIDRVLGVRLDIRRARHSSEPSCSTLQVCTTRVNFP